MTPDFNLNPIELYNILVDKGITYFYHANTVSTSISFLKEKSLLSRKYVDDNKLFQTSQYSDKKDKEMNINDDIFLDFIDIHEVWKRRNLYGPFLFVFSIELLKSDIIKTLHITKKNPVHWRQAQTEEDWYYNDLEDFDNNYKKGNKLKDIGSMIILKDLNGKLPLDPYLKKFIVDNPNLLINYNKESKSLTDVVTSELNNIIRENGFDNVEKELRHNERTLKCACWFSYNRMFLGNMKELKKLFHSSPILIDKK